MEVKYRNTLKLNPLMEHPELFNLDESEELSSG